MKAINRWKIGTCIFLIVSKIFRSVVPHTGIKVLPNVQFQVFDIYSCSKHHSETTFLFEDGNLILSVHFELPKKILLEIS